MKNFAHFLTAHALLAALLAPPRAALAQQPTPAPPPQPAAQRPAQQPPPAPPPTGADEDEVVRITTNLVQVDAVVLDRDGRQVTDLRAEDFEVSEDGRAQAITNFSYIDTAPAESRAAAARPGEAAAPPAARARREQVRRTIAIVVDDLGMAFANIPPARRALRKFIDEQVQPGDLVAVIRTGGEVGALQQFTADKRQMRAAVERIRYNPCSRRGIQGTPTLPSSPAPLCSYGSERGTINALRFTVEGMRELPGRKSLVVFSDSLSVYERDPDEFAATGRATGGMERPPIPGRANSPFGRLPGTNAVGSSAEMRRAERQTVVDPLRQLGEMAVRASIVIYTIDTRGIQWLGLTAADDTSGLTREQVAETLDERRRDDFEAGTGAVALTEQTGGFRVRNSNDIPRALGRIMEDLKGYYLLGYRPRGETFDRRFHRISVRVKSRPDLQVRSRRGFFGMAEEERAAPRTAADRFALALISPFAAGDIAVQLTPVFGDVPELGPFLRAMLHIDAAGLTFAPEGDGWEKSEIVLRGILFGDNGAVAEEHRHAFTLRLRGDTLERARRAGIDYAFNLPVRKPGAYQFRVAVLDRASARVGSAGQFVEVPDLKKNRLAISGIIVGGAGKAAAPAAAPSAAGAKEGAAESRGDPAASPSVRRFRSNTLFDYGYVVYNARAERGRPPQLVSQTRLYRDGRLVYTGQELPLPVDAQTDPKRVLGGARINLGSELLPGEYVLQVTVRDAQARGEHGTASQWIDFEIVK